MLRALSLFCQLLGAVCGCLLQALVLLTQQCVIKLKRLDPVPSPLSCLGGHSSAFHKSSSSFAHAPWSLCAFFPFTVSRRVISVPQTTESHSSVWPSEAVLCLCHPFCRRLRNSEPCPALCLGRLASLQRVLQVAGAAPVSVLMSVLCLWGNHLRIPETAREEMITFKEPAITI